MLIKDAEKGAEKPVRITCEETEEPQQRQTGNQRSGNESSSNFKAENRNLPSLDNNNNEMIEYGGNYISEKLGILYNIIVYSEIINTQAKGIKRE